MMCSYKVPIQPALLGALLAGVTLPAPIGAQDFPAYAEESTTAALPRVELSLGYVSRILPVGSRPAPALGFQLSSPERGNVRLITGLAYSRELTPYGSCCGPEPGYTYSLEALSLVAGVEFIALRDLGRSLTLDARYHPTWYHSIRYGHQEDFVPPPTEWHRTMRLVSLGATARVPVRQTMTGSIGLRTQIDPYALLWGIFRQSYAVSVGLGW